MKTIQIQNGKATYEGLEIENFAECQPLDGIHFKDEQYPLRWKYKDGNYPLPEGWDVVKGYWFIKTPGEKISIPFEEYDYYQYLDELKQTARLIRKEQNSAPLHKSKIIDQVVNSITPEEQEKVDKEMMGMVGTPTKEELRKERILNLVSNKLDKNSFEQFFDDFIDLYSFQVPYDGSNEFYNADRIKFANHIKESLRNTWDKHHSSNLSKNNKKITLDDIDNFLRFHPEYRCLDVIGKFKEWNEKYNP